MKPSSRNIVAMVAFATIFSVVGEERASALAQSNQPAPPVTLTPARTILGGALAGTLLLALAMTGDVGEQFAQGLAIITAASAVIFFGATVFDLILSLEGHTLTGTPTATGAVAPVPTTSQSSVNSAGTRTL